MPLFGSSSDNTVSFTFPEVDSIVWALVDKYFKVFYWFNQYNIEGKFDYADIINTLLPVTDVASTYGNIDCILYSDQGLAFHNTVTGAHGFVHKNGGYTVFNDSGQIVLNSNLQKIVIKNAYTSLKPIIDSITEVLQNIITPLNLISAPPGAPVIYSQVASDLSKIVLAGTNLTLLLEE